MPRGELHYTDGLPSRYSGHNNENAHAHWLNYIDYASLHKLSAADTVARFKTTLKDKASLWIDGREFTTQKALKEAFINKFSGIG